MRYPAPMDSRARPQRTRRPSSPPRPASSLAAAAVAVLALALGAGPALTQAPSLASCPLGTRTSLVRGEGACLWARQTLMSAPGGVEGRLRLGAATVRATPVEARGAWRSAYPADRNDGLLWGGRGLSGSVSGGIHAGWGPLTVVVAPEVARSGNRPFPLPDTVSPGWSRFADPWAVPGLDRYLRPGVRPLTVWGAGDSFVELRAPGARVGASTERLWWGPARRYPLLFSGTSAGFPHLYAESDGELAVGPGGVSLRLLGGHLEESDWFDTDAGNDRRLLAAAQAAWRPGFVPGLEVAVSVVRHEPLQEGEVGAARWLQLFTGDPTDEVPTLRGSSLGTLSFRLSFPAEGLEAYGEVGRGALFTNGLAGVTDPGYAQIYTLGFTRSDVSGGGVHWRMWGELTRQSMELPQPAATRAELAFTSPSTPHGHTHRGQLLGSWIGPGSNAQALGVDLPGESGALGFFAERVRRDDDTYWRVFNPHYSFYAYDLEWTLAARGGRSFTLGGGGSLRIHAESGVSRRKNRSFVGLDRGRNWTWVREWNRWADVRLVWTPG